MNSSATLMMALVLSLAGTLFNAAFADEQVRESTLAPAQLAPAQLTPAQARHTLSILQDERKRAELEETLNAIAQATGGAPADAAAPAATATPVAPAESAAEKKALPIELAEGGLIAQVFDLLAKRVDAVVGQLRSTARMLFQIRTVGDWWEYNLGVPERRAVVLDALSETALTLAGALLTYWLLVFALRRPRRLVEDRAAARQVAAQSKVKAEAVPGLAFPSEHSVEPMRRVPAADRHWSLLRRLPFAVAHWILELLPLTAFVAAAIVLLNAFGGRSTPFYSATILIIGAYAATRIALSVVHLMASPLGQGLRLMHISDGAADFLNRWLRWIIVVAVFGTAIADIALQTGATSDTHLALSRLVSLVVHVMLLIMVFRSRKATAAAIRGAASDSQDLFGIRGMLADSWSFVATFVIVAMWLLWSAGAENGFQHVLQVFAWSAAVIVCASLVSIFVLGAIDRAFIENIESKRAQLGQSSDSREIAPESTAKNTYHLLVYRAISTLIGIVAFIALLQVWGVNTLSWFESGSVGRRLASAVATIAVTCMLAFMAWEALNKAMSRRIDRWTKIGDAARAARLRTLVPMLRATVFFIIGLIVLLAALNELGITIGPLLAGASIIGVALGFGSQKLVQDFITGLFLLMENAIQVGDFITVADVSGSVEHLSIRTVRLRASDGALHVVPFSSVTTVTNVNRGIGNASVRVSVTADSDVDRVLEAITSVGEEMRADPRFRDLILADVDIWGVDQVDGSMITILGQIRTLDRGRWPVQRGFNRLILQRFRERDIQFANPQKRQVVAQLPGFSPTHSPEAEAGAGAVVIAAHQDGESKKS
ncbi:mechanosensitive ion channel family protein [Nitrosospira sp. Nsp1]|uniref:mechanosensitive ion channel family protein n=1 Tax=Nitrosospira sp. Nsp1 TaxID=136547 RepID=UPI0015A46218|nr:mechanosensitive ion channel domain-containing protein [Nitrosospira sp. Nsp1]